MMLGGALAPAAYRYAVEGMVRFAFARLSAGDYRTLLTACASDVEHTFPGSTPSAAPATARRASNIGLGACSG
ncbi:MAG TPA: hypothetical protein VGV91_01790, partial [Rubrobacter sp.]|nr:hypothetical protein [Rubrobacter sp.]